MTQNMHSIERPIRIALGLALFVGGGFLTLSTWFGLGLVALGFVPLLTGATGSCPVYTVLGVSTAEKR